MILRQFLSLIVPVITLALSVSAQAADTFQVDPVHSSVVFRAKHVNTSYVYGSFNDPTGSFILDAADPAKNSFTAEVPVGTVNTNNEARNTHLKSPDFFNARQYPTISFKSTAVKKGEGNTFQVTGDLQMHGVKKTVTVPFELIGKGEFPPGSARVGFEAIFTVKMSDFEIKGAPEVVADEVKLIIALEGVKQ